MCLMVGLPREMLDDHRVGTLVTETGSSLHEVKVAVVSVMSQEVVLHLEVHFF